MSWQAYGTVGFPTNFGYGSPYPSVQSSQSYPVFTTPGAFPQQSPQQTYTNTSNYQPYQNTQLTTPPTYTQSTVVPSVQRLPPPPTLGPNEPKLSVTPDRVEKLLETAFTRLENLGTQLRASAQELEEIRAEVLTANNLCDSELRQQLQQANDEIYRLRNQLSEFAERKVNRIDRKDLLGH
eukprot:NODE_7773_length_743_cov_59.174194_g7159_i0.p1 GENE.NODE_7773_length_743_cov_59.174194_g7159_i0~~NODE_7773_length_743_cov_59.174194_g7159_i0.p1  ORF type:complete len:181 (-),score=36.75 NODE_7773_length_743_cov_59.174194_g7159_i0:146-688(-)